MKPESKSTVHAPQPEGLSLRRLGLGLSIVLNGLIGHNPYKFSTVVQSTKSWTSNLDSLGCTKVKPKCLEVWHRACKGVIACVLDLDRSASTRLCIRSLLDVRLVASWPELVTWHWTSIGSAEAPGSSPQPSAVQFRSLAT